MLITPVFLELWNVCMILLHVSDESIEISIYRVFHKLSDKFQQHMQWSKICRIVRQYTENPIENKNKNENRLNTSLYNSQNVPRWFDLKIGLIEIFIVSVAHQAANNWQLLWSTHSIPQELIIWYLTPSFSKYLHTKKFRRVWYGDCGGGATGSTQSIQRSLNRWFGNFQTSEQNCKGYGTPGNQSHQITHNCYMDDLIF